jgi:CubicO group peptidase (beta-lactamase class C family)
MSATAMGLDQGAVDALLERAAKEVDDGLLPSCQLALARDGEVVLEQSFGEATVDTRYVIFSATKAVVASTMWQLLAEGAVRLDEKVADHIPEFAANGKDVITVEQVMLHTSGFPMAPLGPPDWWTRDGRLATFEKWRLNWEPGSQFQYHATSAHWVLAELIERHDGEDFRVAIRKRVLEPLGLNRLQVGVPAADQGDIAPIVHVGEPATPEELRAVLGVDVIDVGEVTEEAIAGFNRPETLELGVPGGGGVSPAAHLALFYQALLHNPDGLWDPEWLHQGTAVVRNHFPDPMSGVPANRTVGLIVAGEDDRQAALRGFGRTGSPARFGHNGAGGQLAWADPDSGLSFVYLTNGHDRHPLRQGRRGVAISSRAAVCAA